MLSTASRARVMGTTGTNTPMAKAFTKMVHPLGGASRGVRWERALGTPGWFGWWCRLRKGRLAVSTRLAGGIW